MTETAYELAQDIAFVNEERRQATALLEVVAEGVGTQTQWNTLYGGAGRLTDGSGEGVFINNNEGLTKTDIENALGVITAVNTLLNTDTNRAFLEKIRNPQ